MPDQPPRLLPHKAFPAYSFVPGRYPHPVSEPAGHSYGVPPALAAPLDPVHWRRSEPYCHGLDLFNAGFYWESHVEWEGLWLACGRKGTIADFLKGLIQLAVAGVKHREGIPQGVTAKAKRAAQLWRMVAASLQGGQADFAGLRFVEIIALAEEIAQRGWPATPVLLCCR